jgi:anti-anti-sigma regulatory factor
MARTPTPTHLLLLSIQLTGEIDSLALPELRRVLGEARSKSPRTLSIDLTGASFVSLAVMGVLIDARLSGASVLLRGAPAVLESLIESEIGACEHVA